MRRLRKRSRPKRDDGGNQGENGVRGQLHDPQDDYRAGLVDPLEKCEYGCPGIPVKGAQGSAEDHREEDEGQQFEIGRGPHWIARDDAEQDVLDGGRRLGHLDERGGLRGKLGCQRVASGGINAAARLDQAGKNQSQDHGGRRGEQVENHRLAADAAEPAYVAERSGAGHDAAHDERNHDHRDQANEGRARGLDDDQMEAEPSDVGEVGCPAGNGAQGHADQNLVVKCHALPSCQRSRFLNHNSFFGLAAGISTIWSSGSCQCTTAPRGSKPVAVAFPASLRGPPRGGTRRLTPCTFFLTEPSGPGHLRSLVRLESSRFWTLRDQKLVDDTHDNKTKLFILSLGVV